MGEQPAKTLLVESSGPLDEMSKPDSETSYKEMGCRAGFSLLLMLIGGAFLVPLIALPLYHVVKTTGWMPVPCTVLSSKVHTYYSGEGVSYSVDAHYRYMFGGKEYESARYSLSMSGCSYWGAARFVATHPQGSQGVCYVNPADPTQSVMYRGLPWLSLMAGFPMLIFIAGMVLLYQTFVPARRDRTNSHRRDFLFWLTCTSGYSSFIIGVIGGVESNWPVPITDVLFCIPFLLVSLVGVVLTVQSAIRVFRPPKADEDPDAPIRFTPWTKCAFLLFVTVCVNCIAWVFLLHIPFGELSTFAIIVKILPFSPFLIIGLLLLVGSVFSVISLFRKPRSSDGSEHGTSSTAIPVRDESESAVE